MTGETLSVSHFWGRVQRCPWPPPTLIDVSFDIDGARIDVAGSESITGRDPIVVLTSNMPIIGRPQRANVPDRRWQISHEGDIYKLELVSQGGFTLFVR